MFKSKFLIALWIFALVSFLVSFGLFTFKILLPRFAYPKINQALFVPKTSPIIRSDGSSISSSSVSSAPAEPKYEVALQIKMPILMYHHIDTVASIPADDAVGIGLRVSPEVFDRQLQYIQTQGYNTVTSFDLADYLNGKKNLPSKPIMLTFDDGYKDNIEKALPLLEKHKMKGDFAIITDVVGTGEYASWDDLKLMKEKGMGIASHTTNHCPLAVKNYNTATKSQTPYLDSPIGNETTPCPHFGFTGQLTTGQILSDITISKKTLEEKLGIKVSHLVYPYGYYNQQVMDLTKQTGYLFATTVIGQSEEITDLTDPFELNRYRVQGQQSGQLSGFFVGYR